MTSHRLVLLRHAKAEHTDAVVDHARPLAIPGRRQATAVGGALAASGHAPDHVLCSSALRTRQTWDLVRLALAAAGAPEPPADVSDDLYDAGTGDLLDLVRSVPEDVRTLLVVGHEPTVSHVAAALAGPGSDETVTARVRVGVPTAAWSVLELDGPWQQAAPGGARLTGLHVPD